MARKIGLTPEEREEQLKVKVTELSKEAKEREAQRIASVSGLPYVDLTAFPIDERAVLLIDEKFAMERGVAAFFRDEGSLVRVGLYIPEDETVKDEVIEILDEQGFKPEFYVISEESLIRGLEVYKKIVTVTEEKGKVEVSDEDLQEAQEALAQMTEMGAKLAQFPVTDVIETILAGAVTAGASDIHLEPEEYNTKLRYRIDGVLNEAATIVPEVHPKIVSRIKLDAGLKINITDKPQDGRLVIKMQDQEVDMRISVLPTAYGETIVIRLLGVGTVSYNLTDLGLRDEAYQLLERQIKKPNGMILVTGPTGSGKTTTLYASLNFLRTGEKKIVTLENPIEYHIEGISQTQIDPTKDLTFAAGLKSILRQDPDVIMVGEIRDFETADIASQAALTGHIVFSTLHTNDSSGVIPRLVDLGLRPFTIAPALNAVAAQRLIRKLDPGCVEEYEPTEDEISYLKDELGEHFPKEGVTTLKRPREECAANLGGGYKGRMGVFEVFEVDRKVESLINDRASSLEIFEHVVKEQGMITMLQDGLLRAIDGTTSLEEVQRVLG